MERSIKVIFAAFVMMMIALVAGCGDENGITGDVVSEPETNLEEVEKVQLPVCPTCPTCPSCPTCPVYEKCEVCQVCSEASDGPVELDLRNVALYTLDTTGDSEEREFYYSSTKYKLIKGTEMRFSADCEDDEQLTIELNDEEIFDDTVECGKQQTFDISMAYLESGMNELMFMADPENGELKISSIEIESMLSDGSNDIQLLKTVTFEQDDSADKTKFKDLSNVQITNYEEFSVDLVSRDLDKDMILEFSGEYRDGRLLLLVNDVKVFEGDVNRRENTITIPKDKLKSGTNYFTFIGLAR